MNESYKQYLGDSVYNIESIPFLHRSCKPLDQIDFRSDVERGQGVLFDDHDDHQDECTGGCFT